MVRVDLAKSFLELFSLWISHRIAEPGHRGDDGEDEEEDEGKLR